MTRLPEGTRSIRVAVSDLNGQARGKRLPVSQLDKVLDGQVRMPLSALNVDILGDDIDGSPLVFESGDRDGLLVPTDQGILTIPWLETPSVLIPTWMSNDDGTPFDGDPRHALDRVLSRYADRGWHVIAATEMEFFLADDSGDTLRPPPSPRSGKRRLGGEILSLRALDAHDRFFGELYAAAEAMGLPTDTATSEAGVAQFEINLLHGPAMKAADEAWLFKLLVKGLARQHDMVATFHAKPYPDEAGSGMHVHFSVLDDDGRNVFDDGTDTGSDTLRHAVAGCLEALTASTLIFAPHGPSFDRLVPNAHAPTGIGWAYENRTAAVRIPSGPGAARRIEHRVAGGDTNPYLVFAAILGAALDGIERKAVPPEPLTGNAYEAKLKQIPASWDEAIQAFAASDMLKRILPAALIRNFLATKRQERDGYDDLTSDEIMDHYLDTV